MRSGQHTACYVHNLSVVMESRHLQPASMVSEGQCNGDDAGSGPPHLVRGDGPIISLDESAVIPCVRVGDIDVLHSFVQRKTTCFYDPPLHAPTCQIPRARSKDDQDVFIHTFSLEPFLSTLHTRRPIIPRVAQAAAKAIRRRICTPYSSV